MNIAIAVDNYKIKKFKEELASAGFKKVKVKPFTDEIAILRVLNVPSDELNKIHKLCLRLEHDFARSN